MFCLGEQITCVPVFIPLIKCKCIMQYGWKILRNAFFCDFRMVFLYLINHLKLRLFFNLLLWKRLEIFLFFHHSKLLIIEYIAKVILIVSDWTSLFSCLDFNVSHVAFSDYKSGFGGKFGIQTERQDPSAVGFDYKEKLAKHESQQGTVFTCYFLTSAATSRTVWNNFLTRATPGMSDTLLRFYSSMIQQFSSFYPQNIT